MMNLFFTAFLSFMAGFLIGNLGGDQKTFKDCATKGEARMMGGGTIKCEIKKGE